MLRTQSCRHTLLLWVLNALSSYFIAVCPHILVWPAMPCWGKKKKKWFDCCVSDENCFHLAKCRGHEQYYVSQEETKVVVLILHGFHSMFGALLKLLTSFPFRITITLCTGPQHSSALEIRQHIHILPGQHAMFFINCSEHRKPFWEKLLHFYSTKCTISISPDKAGMLDALILLSHPWMCFGLLMILSEVGLCAVTCWSTAIASWFWN